MKILIAGCGKVGETLVEELSAEGHDLTVIDNNTKVLSTCVEKYDVMAVQGNGASMAALHQAGVKEADLLIACTGSDELNLLCCMTAHVINSKLHTIARIRNPEYNEQIYKMRDAFALSMTFNPEYETAVEIERLLKYPGFLKRDAFAKGRVEIVELKIEADSKLCNVALMNLNGIVRCRVLVCAVLRSGEVIAPDGRFTLQAGDRVFVTAPSDDLATLLKNLGIVTRKVRRVMIVGGGTVSYYLAEALKDTSMDVQIIEKNMERCVELATLLPSATVIQGDARDHFNLESDGIGQCDALISLTGADALNMVVSLYGNSRQIPHIVTKLGHLSGSSKMTDRLPLGSVICPRKLCCNNIVRYVRAMQNQSGAAISVHAIADGLAEALEFRVDASTLHCGVPLKKLKLKKNVLLVSISRGRSTEIPNGDSCFEQGDTVVVVSSGESVILQLNDIFDTGRGTERLFGER